MKRQSTKASPNVLPGLMNSSASTFANDNAMKQATGLCSVRNQPIQDQITSWRSTEAIMFKYFSLQDMPICVNLYWHHRTAADRRDPVSCPLPWNIGAGRWHVFVGPFKTIYLKIIVFDLEALGRGACIVTCSSRYLCTWIVPISIQIREFAGRIPSSNSMRRNKC